MLEQEHSKNNTLQEWNKIWAINKKHIDNITPILTAISKENCFKLYLLNFHENHSN